MDGADSSAAIRVCGIVRAVFLDGDGMRTKIKAALYLMAYAVGVYILGVVWAVAPAHALLVSTTGYARIMTPAAQAALSVAQRSITANALGSAIAAASGPQSVAVRLVASSVGWPALGVVAGLTLMQVLLSDTQVQMIQNATSTGGGWSSNGVLLPYPVISVDSCPGGAFCPGGAVQSFEALCAQVSASPPSGFFGWFGGSQPGVTCRAYTDSPSAALVAVGGDPGTPQQITSYIQGLSDADPLSIPSNTQPVGTTSQPSPAGTVSTVPVSSPDAGTQVVPAGQVQPNDVVVNPNATPNPGPAPTQNGTQQTTQQTTSTTTTVTNPDGSITTTTATTNQDDAPVVACNVGNHDQRTLGSILQDHMNQWQGSGLLSALNLLKNLTWPSALPVYTLNSIVFGTFTVNFSTWAGTLTALRGLIIALSSFVAYRIIFVGSK